MSKHKRVQIKCNCKSGNFRYPLKDGYGIFLTYACDSCKDEKLSHFRPDIMEQYDAYEPIDEEDYYKKVKQRLEESRAFRNEFETAYGRIPDLDPLLEALFTHHPERKPKPKE